MNEKLKEILERIVELTKNTTVRVVSLVIFVCIIASFFIFPDFYKSQLNKIQSYYYVYLGDKAYKHHKPQEAINNYTRALNLHPKHVRARYNLANLYVAYEDYISALENYEEALKLKPDFMIARIDYAIVLSEAAFNFDKAIEQYDLAIQNRPKELYIPFIMDTKKNYKHNKGVAYFNQGLAWRGKSLLSAQDKYLSRRCLENAIESYEKSLDSIKDYDVYYNLGIANQLLRHYYAAGKNYCKAIEIQPLNYEAHYNLAILLQQMKKYGESMAEFKKAGLLIGKGGDANKTRYVFDMLFEAHKRLSLEPEYANMAESLSDEKFNQGKVTMVGKKLVVSEEFDKAMFKNFKTCANKKAFEEEGDLDF